MKCSFCEQPLTCKQCGKPYRPREGQNLQAIYQPEMRVACPECHKLLTCKSCGFVYGEDEEEKPT